MPNTINGLLEEADRYLRNARFDQAGNKFRQILELDTQNVIAYQGLAESLYRLSKHSESVAVCQRGLELNPESATLHLILGSNYYWTEEYRESEIELNTAIRLDSRLEGAYRSLGALFIKQKRYAEAEVSLNKAIQIDPHSSGAYYNLATCFFHQTHYSKCIDVTYNSLRQKLSLPALDLLVLAYNRKYNSAPIIIAFLLYLGILSVWTLCALPIGLVLVLLLLRNSKLHFQSKDWVGGLTALLGAGFCITVFVYTVI